MTDKAIFDTLVAKLRELIPGFEVRFKSESRSQRLMALLVFVFNPRYLTGFTTTLYPKVYFPSRAFVDANPRTAWKVLCHEYVHLWDRQRLGLRFNLRYLLPQLLAVLVLVAVGAFWSRWFLLAFGALLALAPWPSRGRTDAEMRGYAMSMAVDFWRYGDVAPGTKDYIAGHFTGWNYYRMCPNARQVRARLEAIEKTLRDGSILLGPVATPYQVVRTLLRENGLVKGVSADAK